MDFELPNGETHTMERKRGSESFTLEMNFREDGDAYGIDYDLDRLVNCHRLTRSDIDQELIQDAIDEFFAKLEEADITVDEVISIEVISEQALRKTPYEDRNWDA